MILFVTLNSVQKRLKQFLREGFCSVGIFVGWFFSRFEAYFWEAFMLGCSVGNFWWLSNGRLCLARSKILVADFFVGQILYCPEKWFFGNFLAISQDFVFVVHYFQLLVFLAPVFSFWFLTRQFLAILQVFCIRENAKKVILLVPQTLPICVSPTGKDGVYALFSVLTFYATKSL